MKSRIELTIEHKDHSTVKLTNSNGDTFTYNPQKHEGLEDFLSGAKILPIADVSQRSELFVLFADWLQYNGRWMLPKEQVKEFFKQKKETK